MTATQSNLASLAQYTFRTPNWRTSVGVVLIIAAVTGIGSFDSRYVLVAAYEGMFFIGIPTLAASFLTAPIDRRLGGQLTVNQASLLALVCEIVVVGFLTAAGGITLVMSLAQRFVFDALIVSLGVIFALRLIALMVMSHRNPLVAAIPASIQTVVAGALLFVYSGTLRHSEVGGPLIQAYLSRPKKAPPELIGIVPNDFVILVGVSVLYSVAIWAVIRIVDRPWRQRLGASGVDLLRGCIGYVAEGSHEVEEFFIEIGQEVIIPVTVLSFRRLEGTEKARFVLPMIHPGPLGEIGGGTIPERVASATEGLAFPPHATAGHDFNLVSEDEVGTLVDATNTAYDRITFREGATPSVRVDEGEASILGQAFGDDALMVGTFAPEFADDIDYGVGLSAIAEARSGGLNDVLLVDAHNCNNGLTGEDIGHITPGSKRSFDLFRAAERAAEDLAGEEQHTPELGVASDPTEWNPEDGIGPLGIRVASLRVAGQETAYVLIDGNNMEPGLRDRIVSQVSVVDGIEVMTTDTHIVNTVESVNQVGGAIDEGALIDVIKTLVVKARNDYEPVEVGMATERTEVTVFGNDRTEAIASNANAVISMGGPLVVAVVLVSMALSVLLFFAAH